MAKPARRRFAGCGLVDSGAEAPAEPFGIPKNESIFNVFMILGSENTACVFRTDVV
jgi:hypothetical protein